MSDWIAVVDDDVTILGVARQILGAKKMRVSCLKSGEELLTFLGENKPDIILLDIHMPGMDGLEIMKRMQGMPSASHIPVIILTGDSERETETRGLIAGAMDFITKPFAPEVLLLRVRHTLELVRLQNELELQVEKKTSELIASNERIKGLRKVAATDPLTGLLNKFSVQEEISNLCRNTQGVLLVIDIDSFKLINDIYGHTMGDKILKRFAQIIRKAVRSSDITGRLGDDEFIVFCQHVRDESVVGDKTAYINDRLIEYAHEILGRNMTVPLGASVGAVVAPDEGRDFLSLYQKADEALYRAKQNGKHSYEFFRGMKRPGEEKNDGENYELISTLRERSGADGGLLLPYEQFQLIYRFLARIEQNYEFESRLLVFCLKSERKTEVEIEEMTDALVDTTRKTLRSSDVITKPDANRCMVILLDLNQENGERVIERIIRKWHESGDRIGVELTYESEWI